MLIKLYFFQNYYFFIKKTKNKKVKDKKFSVRMINLVFLSQQCLGVGQLCLGVRWAVGGRGIYLLTLQVAVISTLKFCIFASSTYTRTIMSVTDSVFNNKLNIIKEIKREREIG